MPLQIRRGNTAEINAYTPEPGELIFNSQTNTLSVGNGSAVGGLLVGINAGTAKDAAAAALIAGSHQNISFSYNSVTKAISANVDILSHGTIEADAIDTAAVKDGSTVVLDVANAILYADVVGNATGNVSGIVTGQAGSSLVGNVTGNVVGNLSGIVTGQAGSSLVGNVTGNVTGNIVGDSLGTHQGNIVTISNVTAFDSVNQIFNGDLTGNVTGNVVGDVTGSIVTNSISSADSSSILCDTPFVFETNLRVESSLTVEDGGQFLSTDSADFPLAITAAHDDNLNTRFIIRRSRGTFTSPTSLINQDRIGQILWNGFDGTNFIPVASINARVDDTVSTGGVPGSLSLNVADSSGTLFTAININRNGLVEVVGDGLLIFSDDESDSPIVCRAHFDTTTDAPNLLMQRSRGTSSAPTALQLNDKIFDLAWGGYSPNGNYNVSTRIRSSVYATPSGNIVPGQLEFATRISSGGLQIKVTIDEHKTTFTTMPVLPTYGGDIAAAAACGGTAVNGMMYYDSNTTTIRAYVGGNWTSL